MALRKYKGGCHCEKLMFEAELDLEVGTGRCNCSYCFATRNWTAATKPDKFRWISGSQEAGSYGFRENSDNKHHFCKNCGVTVCTIGNIPEIGGAYVSVRVSALKDMKPEMLASLPVSYMNGLEEDWQHTPKITSYL